MNRQRQKKALRRELHEMRRRFLIEERVPKAKSRVTLMLASLGIWVGFMVGLAVGVVW